MKVKKFNEGGDMTELLKQGGAGADIITGGLSAIYGATQLRKANREFEAAKSAAPSLETPSQYYENYRNAYDSEIARMEQDSMQSNLASSIQALQGAGGRALVGGLSNTVAAQQAAQNRMLSQERGLRLKAGSELARAEERTVGRKYKENVRQQTMAQQAANAARQNVASGLSNVATGVMFGGLGQIKDGLEKGAKGLAQGVKKGAQSVKGAYQMARLNMAGDGEPLGGDPENNMLQFASNFRQNYMWGDFNIDNTPQEMSRNIQKGLFESQKQFRPELSITPVNADLNAVAAVQQQEMKNFNEAQGLARQKSTRVSGFGGTGEPTKAQQYILDNNNSFVGEGVDPYYGTNDFNIPSYPMNNQGGMMTKGSFNHDTNPIDIVQNGVKVAEATGNEYILNPKQAAAIAKESSIARKLFRQFERNAKKNK